jgi:hypothetical protein
MEYRFFHKITFEYFQNNFVSQPIQLFDPALVLATTQESNMVVVGDPIPLDENIGGGEVHMDKGNNNNLALILGLGLLGMGLLLSVSFTFPKKRNILPLTS